MTRFYWRDGMFVDRDGDPMKLGDEGVYRPYVRGDLKPYRSPITGEVIDGYSARREDLIRHNCREVDPSEWNGEYRSEKYRKNDWKAKNARN